jgi:gluconolactonase
MQRIKPTLCIALALTLLSSACSNSNTQQQDEVAENSTSLGEVIVSDPAFNNVIADGAELEFLGDGFGWAEGPVWVPSQNMVLFTDVPGHTIHKYKDGEGVTEYLKGEWKEPNGLTMTLDGRLAICQHGDRRIVIMDAPLDAPVSSFIELVSEYDGKRFSSPNDLDFDAAGNLYFTDPPYGLPEQDNDPSKEIPFNGVYRRAVDGTVTLLVDSLSRPNGVALSNDEKTMYVGQSDGDFPIIAAYDLAEDGSASNGRILYDFTSIISDELPGGVDGLRVHSSGNIVSSGPGGIWVISPEGKALGNIIVAGRRTANCTIGGDGYLYITSQDALLRIKLKS